MEMANIQNNNENKNNVDDNDMDDIDMENIEVIHMVHDDDSKVNDKESSIEIDPNEWNPYKDTTSEEDEDEDDIPAITPIKPKQHD